MFSKLVTPAARSARSAGRLPVRGFAGLPQGGVPAAPRPASRRQVAFFCQSAFSAEAQRKFPEISGLRQFCSAAPKEAKQEQEQGKEQKGEQKQAGQETEQDNLFSRWMAEHPYMTNIITSAVIALLGDALCQCLFEEGAYDYVRGAQWFCIGGLWVGPMLTLWFRWLSRAFPGLDTIAVAKRLALDQLLWAPAFVAAFMSIIATIEGRFHEIPDRLRHSYVDAVIANWQLWVPAQIITFKWVPLRYQVFWANFVSLIWNTYLSWKSHQVITVEEPKTE